MTEYNQETETTVSTRNEGGNNTTKDQENHPPDESIDFNLLRLDSTSTNTNTSYYHTPCTACGSSSSTFPAATTTNNNNISFSTNNKRRCPDLTAPSSDPLPQDHQISKKPKKLFLDNQFQETTINTIPPLRDFTKITLPCTPPLGSGAPNNQTHSPPALRRCQSDPCNPTVAPFETLSGSGTNQTPQSPPECVKMAGATTAAAATTPVSKATTASLPPRPPLLRRTISDPSPDKSHSRSSSSSDYAADWNTSYKLLKRMKDCMKEMNHWWDEFLPDRKTREEYEEDKDTVDTNATKYEEDKGTEDNNATKADLVTDFEEAVSVEKTGECLTINFRCPCRKGYKILLSGRDCYYKLL